MGISRKLVVARLPQDDMLKMNHAEGVAHIDLSSLNEIYGEDWNIISHTVTSQNVGTTVIWVFSMLLERRA